MVRHVRDLWRGEDQLAALIETAETVERVLSDPGYSAVRSVLDREIATIDRDLEGAAKDAAEYAKQLGRRSALRAFDEAAKAIVEVAAEQRRRAEEKAHRDDAAARVASERTAA